MTECINLFYIYILLFIYYFILFQGTPCDLVTGEERRFAKNPDNPAEHISCSVEMVNLQNNCKYHSAFYCFWYYTLKNNTYNLLQTK